MILYIMLSLGLLSMAYMALTLDVGSMSQEVVHSFERSVRKRYFLEGMALYVSARVRVEAVEHIEYQGHQVEVRMFPADTQWKICARVSGPEIQAEVSWLIDRNAKIVFVKHLNGIE